MHKKSQGLYLIGAGGHARSLINNLELNGLKIAGIYDDNAKEGEAINNYRLVGGLGSIKPDDILILSVGDNRKREDLFRAYNAQVLKENIIHPHAVIEKRVKIGRSNQFFAASYINSNACIGDNNILNTKCIVEHEVVIGSHNHVAVGAVLCGRASVGDRCFIGAGAVLIDKIRVASDVIIGAKTVVTRDIDEPGTYVGSPARKVK